MTKAITVRLDEADYAALEKQAEGLRVRPGTLARILVHTGLRRESPNMENAAALAALERLVRRAQGRGQVDAVALVAEARVALDPDR